jgi:hypothetical protein
MHAHTMLRRKLTLLRYDQTPALANASIMGDKDRIEPF